MEDHGTAQSKSFDTTNPAPPRPSKAYEQATKSPVYRLSELMFGSLLASYVLGFIGFSAVHAAHLVEQFTWPELIVSLPYLFISFTFAYLTAGFYLSYTAGILTMPPMQLRNLRSDFLVAMWQAYAFGLSMLFPMATPVFLGGAVLGALRRQSQEHERLTRSFFHICAGIPMNDYDYRSPHEEEFSKKLNDLLDKKEFSKLSGWKKVHPKSRKLAWWSIVFGVAISCAAWSFKYWKHPEWRWVLSLLIVITNLIVAVFTFRNVREILSERADFLYKPIPDGKDSQEEKQQSGNLQEMTEMDRQFIELFKSLRAHGKNNS
jgi:hypothetical protein